MGYSAPALDLVRSFGESGLLPRSGAVLDLGNQELNPDVPVETITSFVKYFNPMAANSLDVGSFPGDFVGKVYEVAGFEYSAIDIYEGFNTVFLDLNKKDLPAQYVGGFHFVANMGTSEHVTNQLNCFKVVHDAMKVGGIAFHLVPFTGYFNHGLIKYEPRFFFFLALANEYRIIKWGLGNRHFPHRIPNLDTIQGSEQWSDVIFESGLMNVLVQKTKDREFQDFTDEDLRFVNKEMPAEVRMILDSSLALCVGEASSDTCSCPRSEFAGWTGLRGVTRCFQWIRDKLTRVLSIG